MGDAPASSYGARMERTLRTRLREIALNRRFYLSKLVPVPMSTTYTVHDNGVDGPTQAVSWWQWRNRVFAQRTTLAAA